MNFEGTKFIQAENLRKENCIAHGFGTRGPLGEIISRQDWRGQAVQGIPLVSLKQVHGDRVFAIRSAEEAEGLWGREGDAMITDLRGLAVGVFTADCLPILLLDPARRVAGVVHAGWRGTAKGILRSAIEKMKGVFGCQGKDFQAAMGPCIGPCCLEVDRPVKEAFTKGGFAWDKIASDKGNGRWLLDLKNANAHLLAAEGVREENIGRIDLCTSCRRDLFYSHRGEGTRGRQLNFIALK